MEKLFAQVFMVLMGRTVFVFVERKNYNGIFLPGYSEWKSDYNPEAVGLKYIDHMVGNTGWNRMNEAVKWFEDVMGFVNFLSFDDKQITTEYSALILKVMSNGNGRIKFPINEPANGKKRSQITRAQPIIRPLVVPRQLITINTNTMVPAAGPNRLPKAFPGAYPLLPSSRRYSCAGKAHEVGHVDNDTMSAPRDSASGGSF